MVHVPAAAEGRTNDETHLPESFDNRGEEHPSQGETANKDEVREMQKAKRATKISQDVEKQYPVEEDEAYLMDDLGPCRSQHSTPANSVKPDEIGFAC